MTPNRYTLLAIVALMLASCGRSDGPPRADRSSEVDQHAAGGHPADGRHNTPAVDFHKLQDALPAIPGYTKGAPAGATMQFGDTRYSTASAEYANGDARVTVAIYDYAFIESMLTAYKTKISFENDEGYAKSIDVGGFSGWESWQKEDNTSSAIAILNDRFVVVIEGENQSDAALVRNTLRGIDLHAIAGLQ